MNLICANDISARYLENWILLQAQGNKEACWCMLESEKPRMSEAPVQRSEVTSAPPSPTIERPVRPPASRTFTSPNSRTTRSVESANALIQRQLERKGNLERELQKEKKRLTELQKREHELKCELNTRLATCNVMLRAKKLSEEISVLRSECSKLCFELESQDEMGEPVDELCWCCHLCTFRNHHLLSQCESCSMPRVTLGRHPAKHLFTSV